MASISVGDIVLCSQIAYRLLAAATVGRRDAPSDLRELSTVLLALNCSLTHLQNAVEIISSRSINADPETIAVQQNLGFMVVSCRKVLEDLERSTAKYRDAIEDPRSIQGCHTAGTSRIVKIKSQWRSFMWVFRGESLTRYRQKLETHTAAINLILNTCIWSTADRIENNTRRQNQRMEELLCQASYLNGRVSAFMHPVASVRDSESRLLALQPALPA
ncbi:unnamed protein product [Penicillium salamii]|nr:unnamed protein product [Penicillium salamii]